MNRTKFKKLIEMHFKKEEDINLLMLAYRQSKNGHFSQKRDGGEWYFNHPRRGAVYIIEVLRIYDRDLIIAMLLHDVREDAWILDHWDMNHVFGGRVARIVDDVSRREGESKEEFLIRVSRAEDDSRLIKLVDRLDNLSDLEGWGSDKILKYIHQTEKYILPWADSVNKKIAYKLQCICDNAKQRIAKK